MREELGEVLEDSATLASLTTAQAEGRKPSAKASLKAKTSVQSEGSFFDRQRSLLRITYVDRRGEPRFLELSMPSAKAAEWHAALTELLGLVAWPQASPAHWRWVLSCMQATDERGAQGFVGRDDASFSTLLNRANIELPSEACSKALEFAEARELPTWLSPGAGLLNARQVAAALLMLSTAQPEIEDVFMRIGAPLVKPGVQLASWSVTVDRWLRFYAEQARSDVRGPASSACPAHSIPSPCSIGSICSLHPLANNTRYEYSTR